MKIKEEYRLKFLKLYEDFSKKGIPAELKHMSSIIRKDLIKNGNNSFLKQYEFSDYKFNIKINYIKGNRKPYFSNVNIYDLFYEHDKFIEIPIEIQDIQIDIDYLLSSHIYDVYTIIYEYEIYDFYKEFDIQKFKGTEYTKFTNFVYLSLEHELIARYNMLYPTFRWTGITDKGELKKLYKKLYIYENLIQLKSFNHIKFINDFKGNLLNKKKNVAKEKNFCKNSLDLINFYKKWEDFFNKKADEFLNYADSMFDDIISDIKDNKIYEKIEYEYNEYNINGARKIFKEFYNQIFQQKN